MLDVMRRYSTSVDAFLEKFLAPYRRRWRLDYASFRPLEEKGRDLPLRHRNDLLHTDAFPTRPTRGWRILRFFHNIHPSCTRDWIVSEAFSQTVQSSYRQSWRFRKRTGGQLALENTSRKRLASPAWCRSGNVRLMTSS